MFIFSGLIPWYVSKLDSRSQLPLYSRFLTGVTKIFIVLFFSFSDVERQIIANSFIGVNIHNHWIRIQLQVFDDQN